MLYTRKEAADILKISTRTLDRYRERGKIKGYQISEGCAVRYTEESINNFLITIGRDEDTRKELIRRSNNRRQTKRAA